MKYGGLVLARLRAVSHFLRGPSLESEIISEKKIGERRSQLLLFERVPHSTSSLIFF